jgi:uncharacterized membrane protein YfcA
VAGALLGSTAARLVDGQKLLALFGLLMIVVGGLMFFRRETMGNADVRLTRASAAALLYKLVGLGLGTGLLAGFFGIGGGFLVVPALMLATGMTLPFAIGTSLIAVAAFGASTAVNYAVAGLIDWRIAALFIVGGIAGGLAGSMLGQRLAARKGALGTVLAAVIVTVGIYVVAKGFAA